MSVNIFTKLLGIILLTMTVTSASVESAKTGKSVLLELYGTEGQADDALNAMISKLDKIGFNTSAKNEHIENHYYHKFKEKNLDLLNFYMLYEVKSLRTLLLKNPDFGAYAPFNLLAYKKLQDAQGGDTTWYGHLNAETMLKIIGEKDEATKEKFKAMMSKVDKHVQSEMKPTKHKTLTYSTPLPKKPLLKMVKKIGDVDDIDDYLDDFISEHDSLFTKNKFIIAGLLDLKFEYDDLDLDFETYDAYWVSSLCHLEFSNTVFNHGDPQAGAFAPCSVYFYVPKGSGELHVGYASVDNWLATTGITDPKKIAYMKKISASVIRIFKELGFKMEDEERVKSVKVDSKAVAIPVVKTKKVEIKKVEAKAEKNSTILNIVIPTVPKVPTPINFKIHVQKANPTEASMDRSIKYDKHVPPHYLTSEQRYSKTKNKSSEVMVGEVKDGRISTYLRTGLMSVDEAKSKLKNAGFEVLAVVPLDKKKNLISLVFSNDALKKISLKENRGHLATLRLLINKKEKKVSITNPLYLAKAFLQDDFKKEPAINILKSLVNEFKGVKNSEDKLKFQLLPKYQFMDKLPYYNDYIVVARGETLKAKLVDNKRVAFSMELSNGAILIGVKLNKRTQKFPNKIGTNNAGMLPYPLLIEKGEAKILDPKYYLSLMYPKLTMEGFMTIATIPDAIENDCKKVFR